MAFTGGLQRGGLIFDCFNELKKKKKKYVYNYNIDIYTFYSVNSMNT